MNSEEFIFKAKQIVLNNLLNHQFGVETLAKELGIGRSELYKRIKAALNKSASQFIREIRLQKASELLDDNSHSIAEIAYLVGFNSPTYFSTCFKEYFGYSPSGLQDMPTVTHSDKRTRTKKWTLSLVTGVILLLILSWVFVGGNKAEIKPEKSLAVLKFDYLGSDPDESFLANGLAEEIVNSLSNIGSLKVITGFSSFQVEKDGKLENIGKRLGVNYLVDGTLSKDKDRIKASIMLIEAKTGYQLWAKSYEERFEDFFEMQEQISAKVVDQLKGSFIPDEESAFSTRRTTSIEAFQLYSKAYELGEKRSDESIREAINLLERAVDLDPQFAEAYAELSVLYGQKHYYGSLNKEERDKMMAKKVQKALELNSESPEVLFAKADYDFKRADLPKDSSDVIAQFRKVLEIKPNNARCNYRLYQLLRDVNQHTVAHGYLESAIQLDPLNGFYKTILARDFFWKWEEREKGFELIEEVLKDNPERPGAVYFKALMLADEPRGDYLSAYKLLHEGLKEQPYTYGYLFWGTLITSDMDFLPLAKKYMSLIQLRFPHNYLYTYEPAFKVCIMERRFDDALDLTRIWVRDKWLEEKIGAARMAQVYYLKGDISASREILLKNFSDLFKKIEAGELAVDNFRDQEIGAVRTYIEVLRKEERYKDAMVFADFLCAYFKGDWVNSLAGNKSGLMECYYLQNNLDGFLNVIRESFFETKSRLAIYSSIKSLRYTAFEEHEEYQKLIEKIELETHRMRADLITYLKAEGDWDSSWAAISNTD